MTVAPVKTISSGDRPQHLINQLIPGFKCASIASTVPGDKRLRLLPLEERHETYIAAHLGSSGHSYTGVCARAEGCQRRDTNRCSSTFSGAVLLPTKPAQRYTAASAGLATIVIESSALQTASNAMTKWH